MNKKLGSNESSSDLRESVKILESDKDLMHEDLKIREVN
jgi:hypothetical protein